MSDAFPPAKTYCPCGKPEIRCAKCGAVYCNAPGHLSANHVCVDPRQMEFGDEAEAEIDEARLASDGPFAMRSAVGLPEVK